MPTKKCSSSSSSHRSNSERDKKRSRRSSSRDRHRRDGKSSKNKSHRTSRSRSPLRESSSTTDKERKTSSQTSTNQTTTINEPLGKEAEQKRLEEEMQKRKNRIEQWRAERRIMVGIDKVMQQSIAQSTKSKTWSLEDERDEDEEDLQNVVIPSIDLKRDVAAARQTERAAQAAALTSAVCVNAEKIDDEEEDPLDKFMEDIAKEVKSFRGTNTTIISTKSNENNSKVITTIKQEQLSNNTKGSVIKIIRKTIKNESTVTSTNESNNGTVPITNDHHNDSSIVKTESMDTSDQSSSVPSRLTVRSGVAKRAKEKSLIMEQDIDDFIVTNHDKIYYRPFRKDFYTVVPGIANMTEAEVATYREELDGIKVVGKR
ncbi:unnamed protein product [Rotaria sordida]|nr:unnamed protein product [Rotaria sordida]